MSCAFAQSESAGLHAHVSFVLREVSASAGRGRGSARAGSVRQKELAERQQSDSAARNPLLAGALGGGGGAQEWGRHCLFKEARFISDAMGPCVRAFVNIL